MQIKKYLQIIEFAENLKNNTRHSYTSSGRHESVAEHSWRLALMAYFVRDEFPDLDIDKLILMCIFHDFGEAITGDIPSFEKTDEDRVEEDKSLFEYLETMPSPYREDLKSLFKEIIELKTPEAKLCKALDKLEAVIQHNSADISTWLPLEYELNKTYGEEESQISDYTKKLRQELKRITIEKIKNEGDGGDRRGE